MKNLLAVAALMALAAASYAVPPVLDGTINSAEYGAGFQIATQSTQTNFGDATTTTLSAANGSELDTLSVASDAGDLYIAVTGNLESNGNQLQIFIDADNNSATGATSITTDNYATYNGITFPVAFGYEGGLSPNTSGGDMYVNSRKAAGNGATSVVSNYEGTAVGVSNVTIAGISFALNNSNVAGVAAGTGAAVAVDAQAVTTGLEVKIPAAYLTTINNGTPVSGTVKLFVAISSSGGYFSNQILPALATPADNLGSGPNFSTAAIVPASYVFPSGIADWMTLQ